MRIFFWSVALFSLSAAVFAQVPEPLAKAKLEAAGRLKFVQPEVEFMERGAAIDRVYGAPFSGGPTPESAFQGFVDSFADLFVAGEGRLEYAGEQELMFGKFLTGTFRQFYGPYPVDEGQLTLLARNQLGNPVVLAVNGLKPVFGQIAPPRITARNAIANLKKHHPTLRDFETPELVIWSGESRPHLTWSFIASSPTSATGCTSCGSLPERVLAFVDAHSGKILEERDMIWSVDMNGTVSAWATPGLKPDQANNPPTLQPLNALRVNITGGNFAHSNPSGGYAVSHGGSTAVTVNAPLTGRWARVVNQAQATSSLSQLATPPGPANFIYNLVPSEFTTSEVNGYIHTDRIHDFIKAYSPAYPGVDIQLPVNVNLVGSCNAFYNGSSINFYRAGAGCPNLCFSSVIWHEYGHFVIHRGGTSQGAYGEGMSDTLANLLGDTPWIGEDFRGPNTGPLRNAINPEMYPSANPIHTQGRIVSGAFWNTLLQLDQTVGHTAALNLVRSLAINSILLHPVGVTPGLTVDVLTLDDNDAFLSNGTPHYNEIAAGFGAKNLTAPPIEWVKLTPYQLPPDYQDFDASYPSVPMGLTIEDHAGTGDPATYKALTRWNDGAWLPTNMLLKGDSVYFGLFKKPPVGTLVDWYAEAKDSQGRTTRFPLNAPNGFHSYLVARGLVTIFEDTMATDKGWTVQNTAVTGGAWTRVDPNSTSYNGWQPNPANDSDDVGAMCFFTGQGAAGGEPGDADVDGGPTRLLSPVFDLTGTDAIFEYRRWFFNDDGDDAMVVEVSNDNGATWHTVETVTGLQTSWVKRSFRLKKYVNPSAQVRFRFSVSDNPNNSITEAGVDTVVVKRIIT